MVLGRSSLEEYPHVHLGSNVQVAIMATSYFLSSSFQFPVVYNSISLAKCQVVNVLHPPSVLCSNIHVLRQFADRASDSTSHSSESEVDNVQYMSFPVR